MTTATNPNKALWEKGDFTRIAATSRESGEELVRKLGITESHSSNYPGTPAELVADFRDFYGPTMNAVAAAEGDGREAELQAELENLFNEQNTADNGTSIPATFLRVTVHR